MSSDENGDTQLKRAHIKGRDELRDAVAELLTIARRQIKVFSPVIDNHIFGSGMIQTRLSEFASGHHRNQLRIIIEDDRRLLRYSERFVETCRRFGNCIQLRRVGEEHRGYREMFIVADNKCYLNQLNIEEADAVIDCESLTRVSELNRRFDTMWDRSEAFSLTTPGL